MQCLQITSEYFETFLILMNVCFCVSDSVDDGSDKTLPGIALSKWEKVEDSESSGTVKERDLISFNLIYNVWKSI